MGALINPTIMVNGEPVAIKPNSFSRNKGRGTRNIRTETVGGGEVTQVYTEDIETKKGVVKFSLLSTSENLKLYDAWVDNKNLNVVECSQAGYHETYQAACIVEDTEVPFGQDGNWEVTFTSLPAI